MGVESDSFGKRFTKGALWFGAGALVVLGGVYAAGHYLTSLGMSEGAIAAMAPVMDPTHAAVEATGVLA